ncbi:MAG: chromatin-remodelling complex, RSC SWI/SNF subunit Rsc7/Swp82, partial [Piptocephalis tieghemiana]
DSDPLGEAKISKDGILQGGRQWKVPVFSLPARHPTRLYMMSRDPTRLLGYHNSSIFHLKHPSVRRLQALPEDRPYLDSLGLISSAMRKREISIVTARSVFKALGHLVILGGKYRVDDY